MSFNLTVRRVVARVVLVIVTGWLVVLPSISYAFLPVPVALIVYGGSASAGGTAVGSGVAGLGLLMGFAFAFIGLSDSNGNQARLPLTSDPDKAVPAPYAPASATPETGYTYYQTTGFAYAQYPVGGFTGASALEVCNLAVASDKAYRLSIGVSWWWVVTNVDATYCLGYDSSGGGEYPLAAYSKSAVQFSCLPGYSLVGSSCQLSNARLASPDNNCDYTRSGSALAVLSDSDCGGGARLMDCNVDGSVCTQTGTNPVTGFPRTVEIRTNPDGGSTIIQRDESLVGSSTVTDSATVIISPAGVVTSVSGETTSGSLPVPGTEPTGASVQPVTINFPTDYARSGEAQTAADRILDRIDSGFQNKTIDGSDVLIDANYDNLTNLPNTAIGDEPQAGFGWLPSLLPGQVTTCEKLPINTSFTTGLMAGISGNAEIDICPYLGGIRDIIGWLFWVATVMHVFYRFIYSGGRPL